MYVGGVELFETCPFEGAVRLAKLTKLPIYFNRITGLLSLFDVSKSK
jgi:hypothetical protein